MYRFFFSIPEDAFILCIGFFDRFRKMLLEAEIIDSVFYVCHRDYIYIPKKWLVPFFDLQYLIFRQSQVVFGRSHLREIPASCLVGAFWQRQINRNH